MNIEGCFFCLCDEDGELLYNETLNYCDTHNIEYSFGDFEEEEGLDGNPRYYTHAFIELKLKDKDNFKEKCDKLEENGITITNNN